MESKNDKVGLKEKVLVVSIDFDGCLGGAPFARVYSELLTKYKDPKRIPAEEYEKAVVKANQVLFDHIKKMSGGYDRVITMVGSNRTSAEKDQHDGVKNKNGSVFRAIQHFSNALAKEVTIPVVVNKRVAYDSILNKKIGHNFDLKTSQTLEDFQRDAYGMSGDSKYRLSYFQIQDVCANNPNSDVTYVHVDDRDDIVTVSARTYKNKEIEELLPENLVNASFLHYEEYNPIAHLLRLQREMAVNLDGKIPVDESYLQEQKTQIHFAVSSILKDMEKLLRLTYDYEKDVKFDEMTQIEINSAEAILEKLPAVVKQLEVVSTLEELNQVATNINKVMGSNVRFQNMNLPSDMAEVYVQEKEKIYKPQVSEFGRFDRKPGSSGKTIPADHYDLMVTRCFRDDYSDSSDPLRILQQVTKDARCAALDLLTTKLKEKLTSVDDKWGQMIKNGYQALTKEDYQIGNEKVRAIKELSNSIVSLRQNIYRGVIDSQEAMPMIKNTVNNAITKAEKVQKEHFFGKIGVTHSGVAKQLKQFIKEELGSDKEEITTKFKKKMQQQVDLPGSSNEGQHTL